MSVTWAVLFTPFREAVRVTGVASNTWAGTSLILADECSSATAIVSGKWTNPGWELSRFTTAPPSGA